MEANKKHTTKMKDNLHPYLEEASGMAPKMRMFEELREMERERRKRIEMARVQQEENEREERRRQRKIMEDEWKQQRREEDRMRQEERSMEVMKQAMERQRLEREKLEEEREKHKADVQESEAPSAITSTCLKKHLEIQITEPDKEEELRDVAEEDGVALQVYEEEVEFEEVCLMFEKNQPETSQNTQGEILLNVVEILEEAAKEPAANNKERLNIKQKAFNWLNKKLKKRTLQTIEQTYQREAEEDGDALRDEEEDVKEEWLMFGKNLTEPDLNSRSESLLSVVEIPEEATEEQSANNKERLNFRQKAFNWLNKKLKKYILQKIERTYQREAEEGSEPYLLPLVRCMAAMSDSPLPTRADRERAKREKLVVFEEQRQKFEDHWNQKQAQRAERKEARKNKAIPPIQHI